LDGDGPATIVGLRRADRARGGGVGGQSAG
jgi:hypothetical protein